MDHDDTYNSARFFIQFLLVHIYPGDSSAASGFAFYVSGATVKAAVI